MAEDKPEKVKKPTTKKKPAVKAQAIKATSSENQTKAAANTLPAQNPVSIAEEAMKSYQQTPSKPPGLLVTIVVSAFFGLAGAFVGVQVFEDESSVIDAGDGSKIVLQESELIANIAEKLGPSVVSINVESESTSFSIFGSQNFSEESAGTGIILTQDGFVMTNKHVIPQNATTLSIVLADGTEYTDVEVVGRDPFNDIAFLKINDVSGLTPAAIGDSSEVRVGDKVIAIGNALGEFNNTVTAGIISGQSRPLIAGDGADAASLQNLFQTDASINPGNSGGPLVNLNGEVIGINTAIAGGAENIGFSIPINDAKAGITSVTEQGRLIKPYLGVRYITISNDVAKALDLPVNRGAYLDGDPGQRAVITDSPADKAGLKSEDIIIKVNGTKIDENNSLVTLVGLNQVGEEVALTLLRDGQEIEVKVTLEEVPEELAN